MSLGLAQNSALGGLRLSALGTRLVAENLANADAPNYGPRSLVASGNAVGVAASASRSSIVQRNMDPVLLGNARNADTQLRDVQSRLAALETIETAFGLPGEPGSLHTRMVALESTLHAAAASPDSTTALLNVARAGVALAEKFNTIEARIQSIRKTAEASIGQDVSALNQKLAQVVELNDAIQQRNLLGGDAFTLLDNRQQVISEIAAIMSITEIPRENGRVMLVAENGMVLADRDAARFAFSMARDISPADTFASGPLSALSMNGHVLSSEVISRGGGRLAANFAVRDQVAPEFQQKLDLLTNDILARFSGPEADSTLPAGRLGLFTLEGATTLPTTTEGLAGRLRFASELSDLDSAMLWRLRSGLDAATPGPVGDTANLTRQIAAVEGLTRVNPGGPARNLVDHVAEMTSMITSKRLAAEDDLAYHQTQYQMITESLGAEGVNTDREMQNLLELEQAYAANARVLTTIDEMMRTLLEI